MKKNNKKVFGWEEWGSEIGMGDFHFNCLVGKSPIPILIAGWNENGSIYIELNPYSPLHIQIFIPILIPFDSDHVPNILENLASISSHFDFYSEFDSDRKSNTSLKDSCAVPWKL